MGFRFRKSFGKGPFRVTVSKSGVGYSVGGKGFRYTKKANGGTRTTYSIPGTGISYVEETGHKKHTDRKADTMQYDSSKENKPSKYCPYCYRQIGSNETICYQCAQSRSTRKNRTILGWSFGIIILTLLLLLASCGSGNNPNNDVTPESTIFETALVTEAPTNPVATVFDIESQLKELETNSGTISYVLNTDSKKFHKSTCSRVDIMDSINRDIFTGTRTEIIAQGYTPCGICNP